MTALVFDFGLKHIGIAVALPAHMVAHGIATVPARDGAPRWDRLDPLVAEWRPGNLVVGEPLNMDGSAGEMAAAARRFGSELERRYRRPVEYADERLSTFEALDRGAAAGASHAVAAEVIAETWLLARARLDSALSRAPSAR